MVQVSYRNSYEKVPKNEWVQVDPPCAQTGVKSSLGTEVLRLIFTILAKDPINLTFKKMFRIILLPSDPISFFQSHQGVNRPRNQKSSPKI